MDVATLRRMCSKYLIGPNVLYGRTVKKIRKLLIDLVASLTHIFGLRGGTALFSYFVVILLYSLVYDALPVGSFYAPYASREQGAIKQEGWFESILLTVLRDNSNTVARDASAHGYADDITSHVMSISPGVHYGSDRSLDVKVNTHVHQKYGLFFSCSYEIAIDYFHAENIYPVDLGAGNIYYVPVTILDSPGSLPLCLDAEDFFFNGEDMRAITSNPGSMINQIVPRTDVYYIFLSKYQYDLFVGNYYADKGDPKFVLHHRLRALYFSMTTITTTGFGDIVPVSTLSRMIVGSEAIVGWIIAGVFLSSIAGSLSPKREE